MIVTLLTDFGTVDYFVGAMKGAVLSVNPRARIVDITHEVPAHDVEAGAFTLRAAFETFPAGTVHVAVVDPGVGSSRRAVVARGGGHLFVGPDNGVLGHVYERVGDPEVFRLTNTSFFREPVSTTFHGRDIFAPVAGALSRGVEPEALGPPVEDFVRLPLAAPTRAADGTVNGAIIHIDRFGNCITNLTPRDLPPVTEATEVTTDSAALVIVVGDREVSAFRRFYAEEGSRPGEPFAIWGSAGLLELSVLHDSAARLLGARRGQTIKVLRTED
ncbi:MAG TPA: SAM-dependent chlorinase/fluorinase [Pyrinomonadaceae bacterium]|nr:SAM-dependent chlorinase/fluorinase [Pyrinomonadaceae bacterium]